MGEYAEGIEGKALALRRSKGPIFGKNGVPCFTVFATAFYC